MSAAFITSVFLLWCLQTGAVGAELQAPQNVTIVSLNTNYTLSWDWDQSAAQSQDVTFTTQYVAKFMLEFKRKLPNWYIVCENTSHRSCDLTNSGLHYLGIYVIRVRANCNGNHSHWVERKFCPDKDAVLGPPSKVNLSLTGSVLDVFISDPLTHNNLSMKDNVSKLYYNIVYWEGSGDTMQVSGAHVLTSSNSLVTLPDLKAWTWYCVSVQSRADFYNKSSSFTSPHCMQTAGPIAWWLIFLYFLGSLVICFLLVLLVLVSFFKIYKVVKATFYPSNQLPTHIKEYFCESPGSDIPRLLTPDSESELLCDRVIICPEPVLEIHNPPPEVLPALQPMLEPDSSGRHSRQGSSGSGDSGVYSTGGSSGLQQPNKNQQSSAGPEASLKGPFDSDRVKMKDLAPGLKGQPLITDEGIVDVCV